LAKKLNHLKNKIMQAIKLAIIYYSATGANYKIASWAAAAARDKGASVRLLKFAETAPQSAIEQNAQWQKNATDTAHIPEVQLGDLEWADALLWSVPTRYGAVPAQAKQFLDATGPLWSKGKLINKVVSAMGTAGNPHGGQEATILSLYTQMMHWGCIIAAPGYADAATFKSGGNPYGTSATIAEDGTIMDDIQEGVVFQTQRLLEITAKLI
jgi:NAD(P)H dehydrogenase (quinone)